MLKVITGLTLLTVVSLEMHRLHYPYIPVYLACEGPKGKGCVRECEKVAGATHVAKEDGGKSKGVTDD